MTDTSSRSPSAPRRLAVVDIGTNTIKFSVFEVPDTGVPLLLASDAETVRLGADIDRTGMIGSDRALRAVSALRRFERVARAAGAKTLVGVATEAFRSASNGPDVLATIHASTGWRLQVIDGLEEARLTFRGVRSQIERFEACVVADVGGGSTELLAISAGSLQHSVSIPIGSGRFADRFFGGAPPTLLAIAESRQAARIAFAQVAPSIPLHLPLVLSGGNGVFLERLSTLLTPEARLTIDSLDAVARELVIRPAASIAEVLSISVERAAVLPAGAAIALGAVDALAASELTAVHSGIREGVLWDWLEEHGHKTRESRGDHLAGQVE